MQTEIEERGGRAGRRVAKRLGAEAKKVNWERVLEVARERFGIQRFRMGQREVLEEVFAGRSVVGLMPTGAGKSLTYQLPALFLPRPVVVVSPLIALMQDQQERAAEARIGVEKIDSTLSRVEAEKAGEEIAEGAAQLIYVTPERLEKAEFVRSLMEAGGISLLVVDEAHCIAQWGHDFRPAYLGIGEARKALGMPPVLALTATATREVLEEILESLGAKGARVVNAGTERANLALSVEPTVNLEAKLERVGALLRGEEGTGIIYTASVRSANELYDWLKEHGTEVGRYHGQMRAREREEVQGAFMRGEHRVMIATKAFGLGIDKADIRFVYHFEFPDSLETYYQEAGRAGRDGLPSRAVLLYRLEDKRIQSFFLAGRYPKLAEMEAVYEAVGGRVAAKPVAEKRASGEGKSAPGAAPGDVVAVPAGGERRLAPEGGAVEVGAVEVVGDASEPERPAGGEENLAKLSGVGRRKTQVILHLLQQTGMIRRGSRGYVYKGGEGPTEAKVQEMLGAYEERAENDRCRLREMMHYAEASECRVQMIRRYFDEAAGEPCGRCDNCLRGGAEGGAAGHAARVREEGRVQQERAVVLPDGPPARWAVTS